MAMMIYGAIVPHEMSKVTAECVTIGIVAFAMAVQPYFTASACCSCLPYNVWVAIAIDGLCVAGWCVAIALLSYCNLDVLYTPRNGDPDAWFICYNADNWDTFLTSDGTGKWIKLLWCEVEVDGQNRLIGNGAACQQLRVLIGLAVVSLLFTASILLWTIREGRQWGLIYFHKHSNNPQPDVA
jgi:hypothetical protein